MSRELPLTRLASLATLPPEGRGEAASRFVTATTNLPVPSSPSPLWGEGGRAAAG